MYAIFNLLTIVANSENKELYKLVRDIFLKIQNLICNRLLFTLLITCFSFSLFAERVRIYGYVVDTSNRGIEFVNVYSKDRSNTIIFGTTTNKNGYYDLNFEYNDSITIVYSMLGYKSLETTILPTQRVMQISTILEDDAETLDELEVKAIRKQTTTMDQVDITAVKMMPDASGGGIESLLITFAGVQQNNELSSQYNVRGGNFDENSVYVNGLEIYRPMLIRAGQQEGLSFVNTDMVEKVQFSAGGFAPQYGDKMSSVLDITYKRPTKFEASASVSLLGAHAYVGWGNGKHSQMHGVRYKTSQYLLGALDTQGSYKPNYVDYQTQMTWSLDAKKTEAENRKPKWELTFLGNYSLNSYKFVPDSQTTSFGTYQTSRNLTIYFDGQEKDLFHTAFGALGLTYKPHKELRFGINISSFYTNERETYDITGEYILSEKPVNAQASEDTEKANVLGTGLYHEHARNKLQAGVATIAFNGEWNKEMAGEYVKRWSNQLKWEISAQGEWISDQINEWEWRDSMGYSMPATHQSMELYYSMHGLTDMATARIQGYLQNTNKWVTDKGTGYLVYGVRGQWWSWNKEFLLSPRATATWIPNWQQDFTFRLATGLYYQAPFYKELRDTMTNEYGITMIELNRNIKSQRSVHLVAGMDYYFRAWGRPFKITAEAYAKYMDNVISYTVDNVRVRYSGKNDARAYTTGVDLKLYGELVPGADSWLSIGWMRAKEQLINHPELGWIAGPNEQRYSLALFFEDYIPAFPRYRFHLKGIYSDGLPFGSPRNIENRAAFRTPSYKRVDIGASRVIGDDEKMLRKSKHIKSIAIQIEIFNLIGFKNVNSYFWVTDAYNQQWASPEYLTGRRYNVKLTIDLK